MENEELKNKLIEKLEREVNEFKDTLRGLSADEIMDNSYRLTCIIEMKDYLIYNKELSSKIGFKGIIKKFCYLLVVALSVVIDNLLGQSGLIRSLVIYFFVANDGLSIIENMAKMNVKLPQKLIDALEQIKSKGE